MDTPESILDRAKQLCAMAKSNRNDAAIEDQRGNILLARELRYRADRYNERAAKMVAEIEPARGGIRAI